MPTFDNEIKKKQYTPNIVVRLNGVDYAMREPDSGLAIPASNRGVIGRVNVNPAKVDLKRVNTVIASFSFDLVDVGGLITSLFKDNGTLFLGQQVRIFIGRSGVAMDFSDYLELPETRVKKVSHTDNKYTFRTVEETDRMNREIFNERALLAVDILAGTTTIDSQTDISGFASSGQFKINDEFMSYTSKSGSQFLGVTRAEKSSTAVSHDKGSEIFRVDDISGNPIDLIMQLIISNGGGGAFDVLADGLGIDESLVDTADMIVTRDQVFAGESFSFSMYGIENALKFIEDELLLACNCRLKTTAASKISIAVLDQTVFGDAPEVITNDTMTSTPSYDVTGDQILNQIVIDWDFLEGTQKYRESTPFNDPDSIADFGATRPYRLKFKGIASQAIVNDRGARLLERFKTPTPGITVNTHMDKGLINIGDNITLSSDNIPNASGTLIFATELEVIERAVNWTSGDVRFRLAFTSYSGIRGCFIAPSDLIDSVISQKKVTVTAGRGDCFTVGWKLRLWNELTGVYEADTENEIIDITGDTITFKDNFSTTLTTNHRLKFPDYDEATNDQRRYGFISDDGLDFDDGSATYRITF